MARRTITSVGLLAALMLAGCSSTSSSAMSSASSSTAASAGSRAATASTAPAATRTDPGFGFVYDTVTVPYTDAKEWISRAGVSTQIPEHGYTLNNAVPSADGKQLLVAQTPGNASAARIAIIDLTGRVMRVVPQTTGCFPGGLSATVVVTCGQNAYDWRVLVIGAAGGRAALGPVNAGSSAALSPDGTTVLAANGTQLYTVPVSGGPRKQITDTGQARDTGAWSPDGKHIVYLGASPAGGQAVYFVNTDGTGKRKVADVPFDGDLHLALSPDGTHVLVAGSAQVESQFWTVGVDGSDPHLLSTSLTGGDPHSLAS